MKTFIISALNIINLLSFSQNTITPSKNIIDLNLVRNETYQMNWYFVKDTLKKELGKVTTEIQSNNEHVIVITKVDLKGSLNQMIDSTVAKKIDFSPIYHSSYNSQRDMVLHFGKIVTGYYNDKLQNTNITINDT